VEEFMCLAVWLPPAYLQTLSLLSRKFRDYITKIKNNNAYWCLQYTRLGYPISHVEEPIVDAIDLYTFLDKRRTQSVSGPLLYHQSSPSLPKHPQHLRLVLEGCDGYLDLGIGRRREEDNAIRIGDLRLLRELRTVLGAERFVAVIRAQRHTSSGHISIIYHYNLFITVDQLVTLRSDDLILFLIDNARVNDIAGHDELLLRYVHHGDIVRALLYQGMDPRYRHNILVTMIDSPEVYHVFRDDRRLVLDAHDEVLLERLRNHTTIVCQLLGYGFTLTEDVLRYYITNKCDDLHILLPYTNRRRIPSNDSPRAMVEDADAMIGEELSVADTIDEVLNQQSICYGGHTYVLFEEFAREIVQDPMMMRLMNARDVQEFTHAANICAVRKVIHAYPGILIYGIFSIFLQLIAIACAMSGIGDWICAVKTCIANESISFAMLCCMLCTMSIIYGVMRIDEKYFAWLGIRDYRMTILISGGVNTIISMLVIYAILYHTNTSQTPEICTPNPVPTIVCV